jgi:hypothetical protein
MNRKLILITVLFIITISVKMHRPAHLSSEPEYLLIEDFQKYGSKPYPDWESHEDKIEADSIYSVIEENGSKFLRGSTVNKKYMVQIGKRVSHDKKSDRNKINWDINSYPFLSWDWRVRILPTGANERDDNLNDSAASIYVVFQRAKVPFTGWQKQPANWIKYVWSTTLPVGTVVSKKYAKMGVTIYDGRYIVVASGKKDLGRWITFKRNVLEDYKTHFGKKPAFNPIEIGILTDSNSTKSTAEGDYDNIRAYRR